MTPDPTRTHTPDGPPTGTYDPALDAALAHAFGPDTTPGGWSRPPLLRDDPSEYSPVVRPDSADMPRADPGRYQLLGEIARGGMGVVLKGRDPDLGRDLAVKVLKAEFAGKPAAVDRFVEEAQVGGQLQHPGLVPVYELGRFADGRPFFTMKLVKGRTLATLLAERPDPAADRGRFLKVFEDVAQTVAYAHSKGVIHRDLKPSNVMVGGFGEVQVMDWGLAKVLRQGGIADEEKVSRERPRPEDEPTVIRTARESGAGSETQAGSVLGTPAYMPPEQAGGEIDKLDERADVFGLGAMLCVILTGQPPYVADTAEAARLMAVRGQLADAYARLDGCGADAELVALCKRCLAAERDDRPRHAGEVAAAVTAYLAGVEERAHRAEVQRAAAEAKAAEQRKRRRVQAGLGVTLTAVVGLVGFGLWWQERQHSAAAADLAARQARTAASVSEALVDARQRIDESWKLADFPDWMQVATDKALAAVSRAEGFADSGDPTPDVLAELAAVQASAADLDRHVRLITDIARIQHQYASYFSGGGRPDREERTEASKWFGETVRRFGLDPLNGPVDEVARAVADSRIRDNLLGILLEWHTFTFNTGAFRKQSPVYDPDTYKRLAEVIRATRLACGGPYARWQDLLDREDVPGLVAFAASPDARAFKWELAAILGHDLMYAQQHTARRDLLRAAVDRYPHATWLHHELSDACTRLINPPDYHEALCHISVASVQRPDSALFHRDLGFIYRQLGAFDHAATAYRKAIALSPNPLLLHTQLAGVLSQAGDRDGAIASYKEAIRLNPKYAPAHYNLGYTLAAKGDPDGAIACYKEAIACHREVIRLNPKFTPAHNDLAWDLATGPDGVRDGIQAVEHATRACELTGWKAPTYIDTLAAAYAEVGDFTRAVEYQTKALADPAFAKQFGAEARLRRDLYAMKTPYRDPTYAPREQAPPPRRLW